MIGDDGDLSIWTIYESPKDYPGEYVARRHVVLKGETQPTSDVLRADSLVAIRALLPRGLHCLPRDDSDDPVIVECWL